MTTLTKGQRVNISYVTGVKTPAGHRSVTVTAEAEVLSTKRAVVLRLIAIEGECPAYRMSRTGAKRQEFSGIWLAQREAGAIKNLSSCDVSGA